MEYDRQGRLLSQIDAQGNTTSYEYTDAGKLVKMTDAQGNVQNYTVDGNGFNTSESDWLGNTTTSERNAQNQVTRSRIRWATPRPTPMMTGAI